MSIRNKFIVILLFCLAAFAVGVSFAVRHYAAREAGSVFADRASAQLDRVDDMIHMHFKSAEQAVKKLASLPGIQDMALARNVPGQEPPISGMDTALLQVLNTLHSLVPGVEAAFCGYKNGSFHSSSRAPQGNYDARTQSWYSDTAWGAAETSITDIAISDTAKSLVATVAAKIKDEAGETLGVAALTVTLANLTDTLRDVRLGRSGYIVLFDDKGRVLFDPKAQENLLRPAGEASSLLLAAMQLPAGQHTVTEGGTPLIIYSRMFADSRWKAALIMEEAERAYPGSRVAFSVALIAVAAAALLGIIGVLLSAWATRPLYALILQSKALADGNEDALTGIAGRGPDIAALQGNIGQLTGRVMLLAQAEREHAGEIEAYARKALAAEQTQAAQGAQEAYRAACRDTAGSIAPFAGEAASGASAITGWVAKIHGMIRTQVLATGNVRTTTEALLDDAVTMARQAAETEKSAEAALELIRKADKQSRDMTHAAQALEDAAQALTPGLDAFRAETAHIAAQTALMRDVAEEINVLGLKLSIEVSGAGEAGKKFAPVTEEMRVLAEKTMAAAGAMDAAVASFEQTQAAHALATGKNTAAVKKAASSAAKTGDALTRTAAAVFTTVEQIRVLATALEGMAQTDEVATGNLDAILDAAHGTGKVLKNLDAHAEALANLAARLSSMAERLETSPGNGAPLPAAMGAPLSLHADERA